MTITDSMMGTNTETAKVPTHGKFRYYTKGRKPTETPVLYHFPELVDFGDVRSLPMRDIRPSLDLGLDSPYKLNKYGFTARRCPSALSSAPYTHSDWNDETLLRDVYLPEIETLVKEVTGAKAVLTQRLVMRTSIYGEINGETRKEDKNFNAFPKLAGTRAGAGGCPAPKVHLDFAPSGARTHLRKYHGKLAEFGSEIIKAEDKLLNAGIPESELKDHYDGPRWGMFSIWRPLKTVKRDPLVLSDCRTFPKEDYVVFDALFPTVIGGELGESHKEATYLAYGSEKHEWHWIPNQKPEEVFIIQLFDSEAEKVGLGVAGGVMHSSVEIEGTEKEETRESVEVRCTVIY